MRSCTGWEMPITSFIIICYLFLSIYLNPFHDFSNDAEALKLFVYDWACCKVLHQIMFHKSYIPLPPAPIRVQATILHFQGCISYINKTQLSVFSWVKRSQRWRLAPLLKQCPQMTFKKNTFQVNLKGSVWPFKGMALPWQRLLLASI